VAHQKDVEKEDASMSGNDLLLSLSAGAGAGAGSASTFNDQYTFWVWCQDQEDERRRTSAAGTSHGAQPAVVVGRTTSVY
jgi:hypothetical protein